MDKICSCTLALVRCEIEILVCWKILFFIGLLCMSWKNSPFPQNKRFSFTESLTLCPQKPLVFTTKTSLFEQLFTVLKNRLLTYKNLSFAQAFPCGFQKPPIFTNQKPFFRTNLSLLPSKATLFHPPLPISTPLNLLFAKNTAVLLLLALIPYAVKPEPRTDSNHCRRYPAKLQFSA